MHLTLNLNNKPEETLWRLNADCLNDNGFQTFIENEFKEYMTNNDNGAVSPSTLWDAAKAVLRGKLIMWSAQKKREKEKQIKDLTERLKSLEYKHMECNNINTLNQIEETKRILNNVYEKQIEKKATFVKQSYYENSPNRLTD